MSDKSSVKATKTVKYVALRTCLYNNRWTKRGEIIEVPESEEFEHACFAKANAENTAFIKAKAEGIFYDPMGDAIEKKKVDEVMAGVYRQ